MKKKKPIKEKKKVQKRDELEALLLDSDNGSCNDNGSGSDNGSESGSDSDSKPASEKEIPLKKIKLSKTKVRSSSSNFYGIFSKKYFSAEGATEAIEGQVCGTDEKCECVLNLSLYFFCISLFSAGVCDCE
jgi:hypothetical protein